MIVDIHKWLKIVSILIHPEARTLRSTRDRWQMVAVPCHHFKKNSNEVYKIQCSAQTCLRTLFPISLQLQMYPKAFTLPAAKTTSTLHILHENRNEKYIHRYLHIEI